MHFKKIILSLFLLASLSVAGQTDYGNKVATAAEELTKDKVVYNGTYFKIPYPNGDVPKPYGVCTDVVIRTYRKLDIDLQKDVHEDMKAHFSEYPNNWGLKKTDTNIDHRRVPNLRCFFSRKGVSLIVSQNAVDYLPGDIVSWQLDNGLTHIGMVSKTKTQDKKRYLMVHNIGAGQVFEDCLFSFKITGHYRYGK
ncbi:DUF1287 domain-containing protein [Nonlabens dokdonensis]|uniref:DUF1287 domain-containing protein n=1 Tax=Nonlabens dokdonensis TaxID=328515 RepID=A0A1Z8AIT4_9FLAO|nr:DUF1287 domain-containing protein [Nonlabens dokdonensis]OUS10259.1 DUF1287 domain-containing protein [Nonlabens dokdonensis]